MKKRSFQKSMLMGNTAVVTLVVVVLFICANLYLIHEDAKRIQQQTESNASSILEQIRTTIDGVNEICLQLSANSYIIRIFEGLPNLEGNVFEKSPELDAQTKAFMWSYLIKKDSLHAADAGMNIVIPAKRNRKQQREYDRYLYRLRHLVENAFLHLKRWRGIATRYAKTTTSFLAAVQIRCIAIWCTILTRSCVDTI